ncbi:serine proteinase inhibitor [Ancylostoma caninum]|uniref:Serine proteinase inhibitor n=1 Tax=Ancylostoma caninum TaxID=29170 RepID=A0A368GBG1_ANCCA|nr:serine proteinase inhibitor [Ancylostoma caninum]
MDFGLDMLRQSLVTETMVVSPLSVIFALALVQVGAKGGTKEQINEAISDGGKRFSIEKQYADMIIEKYSAKVEALDFDQIKQAAETIDAFVRETTEGKIKNFIKEDTVSGALSLIINAIYFKAKWEHEFSKELIANRTFHSAANKKKKIEFLNEDDRLCNYTEYEDMEVLSLPYKDTSYALNIILPKRRYALDILRRKLTGATIQKLLSKLQPTLLTISFPKMKIETDFELKEALIAMGVTEMFSNSANLTGIATYPPLKVSDAAHKAIIEVDESGTVAAAATVFKMAMVTSVGRPVTRRFVADHPFIFVLTKDKNPLFMGQFA